MRTKTACPRLILALCSTGVLGALASGCKNTDSPKRTHPFLSATVSVGGGHVCSLTADGTAWCWGSNSSGQLGNGSTAPLSDVPVPVSGGIIFASLSAGSSHT
jgi:alpha-tubulin suppressor-like RCC1 family protein